MSPLNVLICVTGCFIVYELNLKRRMVLYLLSKVIQSQKRDVFSIAVLLLGIYCWIFDGKEDNLHQKCRSPHTTGPQRHPQSLVPVNSKEASSRKSIIPYLENQFCSCNQNISDSSGCVGGGYKWALLRWLRNVRYWTGGWWCCAGGHARQIAIFAPMWASGPRCSANKKTDEFCGKTKRRGTKLLIKTYLQNVFYTKM